MRDTNGPLPDTAFWRAYGGKFHGTMSWQMFDDLMSSLAMSGGNWWVFDPSGDAPDAPVADLGPVLDEMRGAMDAAVRKRSYCGVGFADDMNAPAYVKVFDPWKMGGVCGGSGERILPRWILSRIAPDALPLLPETPEKTGFMARLRG